MYTLCIYPPGGGYTLWYTPWYIPLREATPYGTPWYIPPREAIHPEVHPGIYHPGRLERLSGAF